MQNYDEAYFRAKANRRAGTTWLVLLVFVTIYYCSKENVGSWDNQIWKASMAVVGWSTYIIAGLLLRFKGMAYKGYKYIMGYGYLLFFGFLDFA